MKLRIIIIVLNKINEIITITTTKILLEYQTKIDNHNIKLINIL